MPMDWPVSYRILAEGEGGEGLGKEEMREKGSTRRGQWAYQPHILYLSFASTSGA
ncbi:Uncharacterised protein [uncultured archaeon]|nr:Uncharacterised protein [uncultured archaeon]